MQGRQQFFSTSFKAIVHTVKRHRFTCGLSERNKWGTVRCIPQIHWLMIVFPIWISIFEDIQQHQYTCPILKPSMKNPDWSLLLQINCEIGPKMYPIQAVWKMMFLKQYFGVSENEFWPRLDGQPLHSWQATIIHISGKFDQDLRPRQDDPPHEGFRWICFTWQAFQEWNHCQLVIRQPLPTARGSALKKLVQATNVDKPVNDRARRQETKMPGQETHGRSSNGKNRRKQKAEKQK